MSRMTYTEAGEALEEPINHVQRGNGNERILMPWEVSWWSLANAPMMDATGLKLLMIANTKELLQTVATSLETYWPEATLLSTVEGTKGIELAETEDPDVVILDLNLPSVDALDVLGEIRLFSDMPVIVLSEEDDEMRRIKALEIGADDCISRLFSSIEFLARVKAQLRRAQLSALKSSCLSTVASSGLVINPLSREVFISGELVKLTPTEYKLLTYLVKNEGRVIPHRTLMERVWGSDYIDDRHLLKKYIYRIRQKLNDHGINPQILIAKWGVGYAFTRPKN